MDEKIIIEGNFKKNSLTKSLLLIACGLLAISLLFCIVAYFTGGRCYPYGGTMTIFELFICALCFEDEILVGMLFYMSIVFTSLGIYFFFMMGKCAITVTDKRVIGKSSFGKRVELPLNQISAIAQGTMSSIAIATSSGRLSFWFLKNRDEVFNELSELIKNFQIKKFDFSDIEPPIIQQTSNADELKKFKELLDSGVITQEEFDAKKKQLLGL